MPGLARAIQVPGCLLEMVADRVRDRARARGVERPGVLVHERLLNRRPMRRAGLPIQLLDAFGGGGTDDLVVRGELARDQIPVGRLQIEQEEGRAVGVGDRMPGLFFDDVGPGRGGQAQPHHRACEHPPQHHRRERTSGRMNTSSHEEMNRHPYVQMFISSVIIMYSSSAPGHDCLYGGVILLVNFCSEQTPARWRSGPGGSRLVGGATMSTGSKPVRGRSGGQNSRRL